jgi:Tfp pilus assembly protein PilV
MIAHKSEAGFTSLEALVGATLFSVIAAGLAVTTIGTTKANTTSRYTAAASTLIYDKIEQFRSGSNPGDLAPGAHSDPNNPVSSVGSAGGMFTRTWAVTQNVPRPGVHEVTVTISWNQDGPRSLRGITYVCGWPTC